VIAQSAAQREAQPLSRHAKFDSSNQHVDLLLMTLTQAPPLKRRGPMCGGGQQEWKASTALMLAYVTKFAFTLVSRGTDSGTILDHGCTGSETESTFVDAALTVVIITASTKTLHLMSIYLSC
jgi:hypothetical protein